MCQLSYRLACLLRLAIALVLAAAAADVRAEVIYSNDFNGPLGSEFTEWTSSKIRYRSDAEPPGTGEVDPQIVTNCESPNRAQRFLGEFGGPKFGTPADPGFNRTLVEQVIRLAVRDLPPHQQLHLSFDLYVLKSWDGNSPQYGPDRLRIAVAQGPTLLETSFSNNHKVERQGSYQDFPQAQARPQQSAAKTNSLAYDFFGDAMYHFEFTFPHDRRELQIDFASSLFEGKGTDDESWGLDNVQISTVDSSAGASHSTE